MRKTLMTSLVITFLALNVTAQDTVSCESQGRYRECELEGFGNIVLQRQLSNAVCVEGQSWGVRNGRVWVDRGCRAVFARVPVAYPGSSTLLVCESQDNRRKNCPVDPQATVTLGRQLSDARCIENRTWGYGGGSIWVDEGCRAEFMVRSAPVRGRLDQLVLCESQDGRRRRCAANTRGGVELRRRISRSDCEFGRDWGYDNNGVWVTNGCRAEFAVASWDRRRIERPRGSAADPVGRIVLCESQDGRRNYCRANTQSGVQLYRQLSDSDCVRNRTWGYDRGGIWVTEGCRAEFEVNER